MTRGGRRATDHDRIRGRETFEVDSGVAELRWEGTRATLVLDGVESSSVDVEHPEVLEFEYLQHMTAALQVWAPEPAPVRALHLGAAACALPWAWDARRPGSRQVAVDVDAALVARVREWFALPRSPRLRIRVGEGRAVLDGTRPGSVDVVVRDAFDHGRVPPGLVTVEAARAARAALRPGGLYLANAAHGGPFDARADVEAIRSVFPGTVAVTDPKVGRSARRGNLVVVARVGAGLDDHDLDVAELDRLVRRLPLPARIMDAGHLRRWVAGARPGHDPAGACAG